MSYHLYGGHGLCMGCWGRTDVTTGVMAIVETPDDAGVHLPRVDGRLCLVPQWESQKGQFGPGRRLRYVFFDDGGYVAMCKRYRQHAQADRPAARRWRKNAGDNPAVDLLVGAVNVWCWDRDPVPICRDLQAAGIQRILWSNRSVARAVAALNDLGVLTSRYDIYQDCDEPGEFPQLRRPPRGLDLGAWPQRSGPEGRTATGNAAGRSRAKTASDTRAASCATGRPCLRPARIPPELQTHPYRCRFIDTTTAAPWRECYHPDHPMTRTESRHWKMELLRF